jgi:hypothetical protein
MATPVKAVHVCGLRLHCEEQEEPSPNAAAGQIEGPWNTLARKRWRCNAWDALPAQARVVYRHGMATLRHKTQK